MATSVHFITQGCGSPSRSAVVNVKYHLRCDVALTNLCIQTSVLLNHELSHHRNVCLDTLPLNHEDAPDVLLPLMCPR